MSAAETLLNLLFPPKCPFCRKVVNSPGVCTACQMSLPWAEGDAGLHMGKDALACAAPLFYEGAVRDALLRLKFHDGTYLAKPLGALIAQCAAERFSGAFDVVTWAPVGRKRLKERGYDQARLLAEGACRVWGVKPEQLLVKTGNNPAQSGLLDAAARWANVSGMYALAESGSAAGRKILLIDDICTTGATLSECAHTLLEGGAAGVVCAAVALARERQGGQSAG